MIAARILHKDDTILETAEYTAKGFTTRKVFIGEEERLVMVPDKHDLVKSILDIFGGNNELR